MSEHERELLERLRKKRLFYADVVKKQRLRRRTWSKIEQSVSKACSSYINVLHNVEDFIKTGGFSVHRCVPNCDYSIGEMIKILKNLERNERN